MHIDRDTPDCSASGPRWGFLEQVAANHERGTLRTIYRGYRCRRCLCLYLLPLHYNHKEADTNRAWYICVWRMYGIPPLVGRDALELCNREGIGFVISIVFLSTRVDSFYEHPPLGKCAHANETLLSSMNNTGTQFG